MMLALWKILRGNPLEAATGCALVALLGLSGYLWVAEGRAEVRADAAESLVEAMRSTAQQQNDRYRHLEKEAAHAMQTIIQNDRAALDSVGARLARLREQARAGGSGVPTVPAVAGSLAACQQRLADIGRAVDGVDQEAEGVRRDAGGCAGNAVTLRTCQAQLLQCAGLSGAR